MKKMAQAVVQALGWMGIVFLIGASALFFLFASLRHTLTDWIYAVSMVVAFTAWIILDRRQKRQAEKARNRALEIVRGLKASGKRLGDATQEELEAILVALNGGSR